MSDENDTHVGGGSISASSHQPIFSSPEGTYEAKKARQSTRSQPDKIHWNSGKSFRDSPYRQLHHQQGLVGQFRIRLLEANGLQRSYWSALALGPVKHLGWSKAHGAVSSYCSFSLDYEPCRKSDSQNSRGSFSSFTAGAGDCDDGDTKPPAQTKPVFVSPVVPDDNNPVYSNCQFDCPLLKGKMPQDGMRVVLKVRVDEDSTAIENILPGGGDNSRLLGVGTLDITELCLGETTQSGQSLPGVRDAWVPISLKGQDEQDQIQQQKEEEEKLASLYHPNDPLAPPKSKDIASTKDEQSAPTTKPPPVTGMVRVLVSYQPYGLEPQANDIVALESFARRNILTSSCRPLIDSPLQPLTVLERRGSYLLCEYTLQDGRNACVRVHRNAMFVIERTNAVDAAHNLALMPIDFVKSTPIGQATIHTLSPIVAAGKEVMLPALLSLKLVWMAARTTTLASLSGVQALGQTFWNEGSSSLTASHRNSSSSVPAYNRDDDNNASRTRNTSATAQFVSL